VTPGGDDNIEWRHLLLLPQHTSAGAPNNRRG
jgi:hypothetical protein